MQSPAHWYDSLSKYGLHHVLFWICYALFWFLNSAESYQSFGQQFLNISVPLVFHAIAAYFTMYVLIPVFLLKKQYLAFTIALALTISLVSYPILYLLYHINKEIAVAEQVWSLRFFLITAIGVSYTVFITGGLKLFFNWYQRDRDTKLLSALNTESELKFLKTQINPHFLFNSLNNLYALSLKKSDQTPKAILKLSEILRYVLYEASEEKVPLEKEIEYLKNYIEIEKLRFGDRAQISFFEEQEYGEALIEPMLLIPFVENAFKHGLGKTNGPGFIEIHSQLINNTFFFTVTNNVNAANEVYTNEQSGGIGLLNVKNRLDILYPERYQLDQTKSGKHFQVQLKLELQ